MVCFASSKAFSKAAFSCCASFKDVDVFSLFFALLFSAAGVICTVAATPIITISNTAVILCIH